MAPFLLGLSQKHPRTVNRRLKEKDSSYPHSYRIFVILLRIVVAYVFFAVFNLHYRNLVYCFLSLTIPIYIAYPVQNVLLAQS